MAGGLFKRKVQDATKEAVATVKEAAAKVTTEKMDVWGDAAKLGTFALMAFGAFKAFNREGHPDRRGGCHEDEFVRTRSITVNNYYYRPEHEHRKPRKKN